MEFPWDNLRTIRDFNLALSEKIPTDLMDHRRVRKMVYPPTLVAPSKARDIGSLKKAICVQTPLKDFYRNLALLFYEANVTWSDDSVAKPTDNPNELSQLIRDEPAKHLIFFAVQMARSWREGTAELGQIYRNLPRDLELAQERAKEYRDSALTLLEAGEYELGETFPNPDKPEFSTNGSYSDRVVSQVGSIIIENPNLGEVLRMIADKSKELLEEIRKADKNWDRNTIKSRMGKLDIPLTRGGAISRTECLCFEFVLRELTNSAGGSSYGKRRQAESIFAAGGVPLKAKTIEESLRKLQ